MKVELNNKFKLGEVVTVTYRTKRVTGKIVGLCAYVGRDGKCHEAYVRYEIESKHIKPANCLYDITLFSDIDIDNRKEALNLCDLLNGEEKP